MEQQKPLLKRLDELENIVQTGKVKRLKIPRKAKVRKGKIKKGWVGILKVDENGNISGEKQQIINSTTKLKSLTYHNATNKDILFWEGKFPVIIQPTKKVDAYDPRTRENPLAGKNETKGQKYIMARMIGDTIKVKGKGASIIIWLLIIGGAVYGISRFIG